MTDQDGTQIVRFDPDDPDAEAKLEALFIEAMSESPDGRLRLTLDMGSPEDDADLLAFLREGLAEQIVEGEVHIGRLPVSREGNL